MQSRPGKYSITAEVVVKSDAGFARPEPAGFDATRRSSSPKQGVNRELGEIAGEREVEIGSDEGGLAQVESTDLEYCGKGQSGGAALR